MTSYRQATNKVAFFALVFFAFITLLLWMGKPNIFLYLNGQHHPIADTLIGIISGIGDGLIISLFIACLWLRHCKTALITLAAFMLSGLLAQILKRSFDMPRPAALFDVNNIHIIGDTLQSHSFPSGHASSLGVLLLLPILMHLSWIITLPCIVLTLLAAYGRIYCGVHFPLDVWVGLGLGVASLWLCWQWLDQWQPPQQLWFQRDLPSTLLLVQAWVLVFNYHIQPSTAAPLVWIAASSALVWMSHCWKKGFVNL
ncbi:MAG: phosphatase PAP2 family protein [Mariprofundales bacterium]